MPLTRRRRHPSPNALRLDPPKTIKWKITPKSAQIHEFSLDDWNFANSEARIGFSEVDWGGIAPWFTKNGAHAAKICHVKEVVYSQTSRTMYVSQLSTFYAKLGHHRQKKKNTAKLCPPSATFPTQKCLLNWIYLIFLSGDVLSGPIPRCRLTSPYGFPHEDTCSRRLRARTT